MERILSVSNYARRLIDGGRGSVHSVYRKTVNLHLGGVLLALQAKGTPSSPLSLETDRSETELQAYCFCRGQEVSTRNGRLYVGELVFDAHDAEIWNARLSPSGRPDAALVESCLRRCGKSAGFSPLLLGQPLPEKGAEAAAFAREMLSEGARFLTAGRIAEAATTLGGLLGLGEGLTPSGDDFLCGLLAGCEMCGGAAAEALREALRQELRGRLDQTNDISASLLRCALDGLFGRALTELGKVPTECSVREFASIGHSSGADSLCGVLFACRFVGEADGIKNME